MKVDPVKLPDDVSTSELIHNPRVASELSLEEAADLLPAVEGLLGQMDLLARLLRARLAAASVDVAEGRSPRPKTSDASGGDLETEDSDLDGERSWRVKLWEVPAETRLWAPDLAEAVGRNSQWVHRHTFKNADPMIPHAKYGNDLVFKAGEVRAFLREHEEVILAGPMDSTEAEKRLEVVD